MFLSAVCNSGKQPRWLRFNISLQEHILRTKYSSFPFVLLWWASDVKICSRKAEKSDEPGTKPERVQGRTQRYLTSWDSCLPRRGWVGRLCSFWQGCWTESILLQPEESRKKHSFLQCWLQWSLTSILLPAPTWTRVWISIVFMLGSLEAENLNLTCGVYSALWYLRETNGSTSWKTKCSNKA